MFAERLRGRLSEAPDAADYLVALGLAGVAILCRIAIELIAGGIGYYVAILPAVVLAGVFCGTAPAVLTAILGGLTIAALFLRVPLMAWPPFNSTQLDTLLFIPACAAILWATSALRRFAAEAAIAEARLEEVFRQIPGAAAILGAPDGHLLLRSSQSDDVLGHGERRFERSSDLSAYSGIHPDGTPLKAEEYPIVRALQTGEVVRGERLLYRHPEGRLVTLEVHAGPVRKKDGDIVAAVGMAFNVSERVEAERRREESEERYREAAKRLRSALDARELLMREADHRIKNSLQLVVALLRLQLGRVSDADAKAALNAAMARVEAVAEAHLALQESPDLRTVDLDAMIEDLCRRIGLLNADVTISCDARAGLWLDADKAIPLGLIATELLTNALRHAYQPGTPGRVTVTTVSEGGMLEMVVSDGGVGLPEKPLRRGLGSTVIETLARQIGATVVPQGGSGNGTTVIVRLSLPPVSNRE